MAFGKSASQFPNFYTKHADANTRLTRYAHFHFTAIIEKALLWAPYFLFDSHSGLWRHETYSPQRPCHSWNRSRRNNSACPHIVSLSTVAVATRGIMGG
jgi:hypothetical protein